MSQARLHNSDVEADVALGRCAPSGPRSLTPVVMRTRRAPTASLFGDVTGLRGVSVSDAHRRGRTLRAEADVGCDRHFAKTASRCQIGIRCDNCHHAPSARRWRQTTETARTTRRRCSTRRDACPATGSGGGHAMTYWYRTESNQSARKPLLLFLHGVGETAGDHHVQTTTHGPWEHGKPANLQSYRTTMSCLLPRRCPKRSSFVWRARILPWSKG